VYVSGIDCGRELDSVWEGVGQSVEGSGIELEGVG